jgi:glutamate synthase domain-containing protein 2/glutamate synthase domain-containing protein 1/glutamate synthase domain-containing protein 3
MRFSPPQLQVDHDACGVGFIAQLESRGSRDVVERALLALARLSHRGGVDADGLSGDGAGLLVPIPKDFIRQRARGLNIELPDNFGLGMVFVPPGQELPACSAIESAAARSGLRCLGWRVVPTSPSLLGPSALSTMPVIRQCFFESEDRAADLERQLYLMRKRVESRAIPGLYFCSLSSRVLVYKGLLTPLQLRAFYSDLAAPDFTAPFAIFHQRYSTNTSPSWQLAQPFRYVAHNGEINTINANRRWTRARESTIRREFGADDSFQVLEEGGSDSASFDNVLEVFLRQNYNVAAAMLRMVPPAWEFDSRTFVKLRTYLEKAARRQEPWDGPAALVFSDGQMVGAKLDRNGLRPMRYVLTSDGLLVVGSEVGLADLRDKQIIERNRLGPGEILLVDSLAGAIFRNNNEVAELLGPDGLRDGFPHRLVHRVNDAAAKIPPSQDAVTHLGPTATVRPKSEIEPQKLAAAMGWSEDQYRLLFQPLGREGKEAIWSMGDDAPPAFLSSVRRSLWDYCKQRFAQVTNPPIDPLREVHVMSLNVYLDVKITAESPVLDAGQMDILENEDEATTLWSAAASPRLVPRKAGPAVQRIDFTFDAANGVEAAEAALDRIREDIAAAVKKNPSLIVLTDRQTNENRAALPALLALSAAWKEMVLQGAHNTPLVVESGQIIETHHVALLIAAGAGAVYPYLAMELSENLKPGGAAQYRIAVEAGLRKVLARMGISTIASYRNSHLFETVGLDYELCAEFFEDASSSVGGKSLQNVLEEAISAHTRAFATAAGAAAMQDAGLYRFRHAGERHNTSPDLVRRMHGYIKSPTPENYASFVELANSREPVAIRDHLEFAPATPIPLEEVEPTSGILSRFCAQAMSLGALSPEAHRTLAIAMNRLGARSNTGEGGEDPSLYRFDPEAANRVKQVASARFGVTAEYLCRADELEIKMAQGSKPGEGGQLPALKVNAYIARLRHAVPGMSLISPPPHHDIYSIEDLAQLIYDLRAVNPAARIGVKLVSGAGVGIIAAGVAKAGADVITIAGFDGGTGASPLTSIKNTGLPWEIGLRDAHAALLRAGFRDRVRLRTDGGFKFGRDVLIAALLGADEFGFGTATLLAIGCVMARQCHLNTCPVGIATQDEKLRARFTGNPEMVMSYFQGVAAEVRERMAALGVRSLSTIIGNASKLRPRNEWAERSLGPLLKPIKAVATQLHPHRPAVSAPVEIELPESAMDIRRKLVGGVDRHKPAPLQQFLPICNADRSVGAHLSGYILRRTNFDGLAGKTVQCEFRGSAGQSFGAFLIPGLRFKLFGDANDYVGKSLSGGTIAISAGAAAAQRGDVLAGNTVLYGGTSGKLFIAGRAGERFAVRNSGALAVVEGVGHHGCEYMTAGLVIILGPAGMNLSSGMTGGLTYILRDALHEENYNHEFVRPAEIGESAEEQKEEAYARAFTAERQAREALQGNEDEWLRHILREHFHLTKSPRARRLLESALPLPLVRLQPVHLPCSIAETWAPFLQHREAPESPAANEQRRVPSAVPLEAIGQTGESAC